MYSRHPVSTELPVDAVEESEMWLFAGVEAERCVSPTSVSREHCHHQQLLHVCIEEVLKYFDTTMCSAACTVGNLLYCMWDSRAVLTPSPVHVGPPYSAAMASWPIAVGRLWT